LVDMVRHSKFESEEIDREKGVIVEEMNMYFDTPRDFISGVFDDLVYGDHPLGWDIIGRKETVRAATRETFLDYIGHWYKPSRTVVGVGGRIGDGLTSRLLTQVRGRRGLAYDVFAPDRGCAGTGALYSQAGVDINRIEDAVTTIVGELKRIADEAVPSDELEKARAFAKGRFVL